MLLPVHVCGVLFDLIELVSTMMKESLPHAALLIVSPAGNASLAYANISAEWCRQLPFATSTKQHPGSRR